MAPALMAWFYDRSGDPFAPILLAIILFALTLAAYVGFRLIRRSR
jgi:hypothetical protein